VYIVTYPAGTRPRMTPVLRRARVPGRARPTLAALAGALLLVGALTGCKSQTFEKREVLPMVEVSYDEAIRMSLDEVKDSSFVSIDLHRPRSVHPEWHTVVVDEKDTSSLVRVSASTEKLLSSGTLPADEAPDKKVLDLTDRMQILPEEAAKKVVKPDFGKVTSIHPDTAEERPVWTVVVATIQQNHRFAYDVDGVTGEVLDRRPVGPGDSTLRSPARP
jgi:uncharacterized membrane protein YkoI